MKNKNIGSDFDDFLKEENLLADAEATAVKRAIAFQVQKIMAKKKISKSTLASKMRTSRIAVDRLLNPLNTSVTLKTLEDVSLALNKKLKIEFV